MSLQRCRVEVLLEEVGEVRRVGAELDDHAADRGVPLEVGVGRQGALGSASSVLRSSIEGSGRTSTYRPIL